MHRRWAYCALIPVMAVAAAAAQARTTSPGGYGAISAIRIHGTREVEVGPKQNGVGDGNGGVVLGRDGKAAVQAWAGKPSWVVVDEWGYIFPRRRTDVYEFTDERHMPPAYRFHGAPSSVLYSFYASAPRFQSQEGVRPGMSVARAKRLERGYRYRTHHTRNGNPYFVRHWGLWEITIETSGGRVSGMRVDPKTEPSL